MPGGSPLFCMQEYLFMYASYIPVYFVNSTPLFARPFVAFT